MLCCMTKNPKFQLDMTVAKGVWCRVGDFAGRPGCEGAWLTAWLAQEAPRHPQIEFQIRGAEVWGRWLVGVDKGRTLGGRDAYCFV